MRKTVFAAYTMSRVPGYLEDPQRALIECPVGFEPVEAYLQPNGQVVIMGWQGEGNPILVPHPLLVITPGMKADLLIGEVIREKIGTVILPPGVVCTLFVRGPWPTSTIEAVAAKGTA